jgi:diguanylate cyclase (GGDEF)-like protein/PAS domain S-box-containing protein
MALTCCGRARRAQRQAQAASRLPEARFTALVEHSSDIICLLDREGRLLYGSQSAARLLGYHLADGEPFARALHPDDVASVTETFDDLLLHPGESRSVQARLVERGGGWRHMEIIATNRLADVDVQAVVANVRDITERAAEAARLSWQAFHDDLTGLANRALLQDRLTHALERARRSPELTGLLYVDLDHFKEINDTFGHEAGDLLLVEVADRLAGAVRSGDTVARLGGDEFVILAETLTAAPEAEGIAERVLDVLAEPFHLNGSLVEVTASVGLAFDHTHDPDVLLRDADLALYRAKDGGRARYAAATPPQPLRVVR